jgi:hypothetical protein
MRATTMTRVSSDLPDNGSALLAELPNQPETDAAAQRALRDIPEIRTTPRPESTFSSSI